MRLVPLGSIKIGTVVARSIYDDKGRVLLHSGVPLTESLIDKLKENEILGVHIYDNYSIGEIKDVISPELRNKAVKEIKTVFSLVRSEIEKSIKEMENDGKKMNKKISLMVDYKYMERIDAVVSEMLDELLHNREAMVGLVDIKNMKSFVYQHSIQVTVLSLLIGVSLHMNQQMLKELAIGAMLHDIGLSFLDKELVIYREEFTEDQKHRYRQHCQIGHDFIRENTMLSAPCRMGILQHHEEYNGNGYPLGLTEENIHINARIISVANVYDKMTSGVIGELISPNEVIEYIMGNSGKGRMFDFEIANIFVRKIVPFPIGTYVLLSTGEKAVVIRYNSSHPLRPIVKIIIKGKQLDDLSTCNLIEYNKLNITIKKVIYGDDEDDTKL